MNMPSRRAVLRNGKLITIEPLTEIEEFKIPGFPTLEAFHTSGGTSTMPETFGKNIGECFEKTLRYPGHVADDSVALRPGTFLKGEAQDR